MVECYVTGMLPRPKELIDVTRAYDRGRASKKELEKAFEDASLKAIKTQVSAGLGYVTDGMLKWQDLLRPFAEKLEGVKVGSLARWFNNNTFYRKPIILDDLRWKRSIVEETSYIKLLPKNLPWKAVLPAPYTFVQLSENQFYKSKIDLMFKFAQILKEEIKNLAKLGFKYIQLSDPALVYKPISAAISKDELETVSEALKVAVQGAPIKTCLQTFFGDFSSILPEALDFPVDNLGIDLYETSLEKLKEYKFDKGVALGLVNSRNSLIEKRKELAKAAKEIIRSIQFLERTEIFICPNCDLEFLPWERAQEKMKVIGDVTRYLREEFRE